MKKRALFLLILFICLPLVNAKEVTLTEIINYKVENSLVEGGTLKLLINNPTDKYLQFYVVVNNNEVFVTEEVVSPYSTDYISIPSTSNFISTVKLTAGFQSQDKQDLYLYKSNTKTIQINQEVTPNLPEQNIENNVETVSSNNDKIYVYGNGLVASQSGEEINYYTSDNLKSNSVETDFSGNKVNEIRYDPYGYVINGNANDRISFTGKELDDDGLQYYGARYYDASTGRFIEADPILRDSESNYYYANDNPLKYVDNDGYIADTVLDAFFVGADLFFIGKDIIEQGNPSPVNVGALCADLTCMFTPFITGGGLAVRTAEATSVVAKVPEVVRVGQVAEKGGQVALESRNNNGESFNDMAKRQKAEGSPSSKRDKVKVTSAIGKDRALTKLAEQATKDISVQKELDHFQDLLSKGITSTKEGARHISGTDVYYMGGATGARLYYRRVGENSFEIVAKSYKDLNQNKVISTLTKMYSK